MTDPAIVRAATSDVETVAPLFEQYRAFYRKQPNPEGTAAFLRARLSADEAVVFFVVEKSAANGFALLYPMFSSLRLGRSLILNDLFVRQAARGRGCATRLLNRCTAFGRAEQCKSISLVTAVDNSVAQRLYEHCGFRRETAFYGYVLDL